MEHVVVVVVVQSASGMTWAMLWWAVL